MPKLNRRRFIQTGAAAGAGVIAMPYIGKVLGAKH